MLLVDLASASAMAGEELARLFDSLFLLRFLGLLLLRFLLNLLFSFRKLQGGFVHLWNQNSSRSAPLRIKHLDLLDLEIGERRVYLRKVYESLF
jgi:hypothetical protein